MCIKAQRAIINEATQSLETFDREGGFSLLELLIVVAIIVILTGMAIFSFAGHKLAYSTEDQAAQVLDFMRDASQRALNQRQPVQLTIDTTAKTIQLLNSAGTTVLRSGSLYTGVNMVTTTGASQPTGVTPPTPPNYAVALFTTNGSGNKVWTINFQSDGSVFDTGGAITSDTLIFWNPQTNNQNAPLSYEPIRAITLFGSTGAVRFWTYAGGTFVAR